MNFALSGHNPKRCILKASALCCVLLFAGAQAPSTPSSCDKMSWQQCVEWVSRTLKNNEYKSNPKAAVALVQNWVAKYREMYPRLVKQGPFESDIKKLEDAVYDELDPLSRASAKISNDLLRKYFSRLATVIAFIGEAPVQGLMTFLNPSEVANEFTDLQIANYEIHNLLWQIMRPYLQKDWKDSYGSALAKVADGPQIRMP